MKNDNQLYCDLLGTQTQGGVINGKTYYLRPLSNAVTTLAY